MIGTKIRVLRILFDMGQLELAKRANISQGYLSQVEIGRTAPDEEALKRIENVLGVNLNDPRIEQFVNIKCQPLAA